MPVHRKWRPVPASALLVLLSLAWATTASAAGGLSDRAESQIAALQQLKAARTATQAKVDGRLLTELASRAGGAVAAAAPALRSGVRVSAAGTTAVDVHGTVTKDLL